MTNKEYNGWTNYETWMINLYLTNDADIHSQCYNMAREINEEAKPSTFMSAQEEARYTLSKRLKEYVEDVLIDFDKLDPMITDLVTSALSEVNWNEIAQSFLEGME